MTTTEAVPWTPPSGPSVEAMAAGCWWDATRVPVYLGARVLAELGDGTGAVIHDPYGQVLYWLTLPRSTHDWDLPGVQPLSTATYVGVPPALRIDGDGVRWLVPFTRDRYLTEPDRLYAALAEAVRTVPCPPAVADCIGCRNTTSRPVQVRDGRNGLAYVCPYCASLYEPGPGPRELLAAAEPFRPAAYR